MRYPRSVLSLLIVGCAVASSAIAGDVVVDGNISAGGTIVANGSGFQFPDSTVQSTASFPEHKRIVVVSPVGTPAENGATLLNVIAGISPSAAEPYMLKIEPGVYDVGPNQVYTKQYLDVEGSGQISTRIRGTYPAAGALNGFVQVVSNSELRMLTVENYGGGSANYTGIHVWNEANVRISDVTVLVHSGTSGHTGIDLGGQGTVLKNATIVASGGSWTVGLWLDARDIIVDGAHVRAIDGSYDNDGVISSSVQGRTIMNSIIEASGAASSTNTGLYNRGGSDPDIFNCIIRAFGAVDNYAVHNYGTPVGTSNGGEIEIHNSRISGEDLGVFNESSYSAYVAASQLKGPVSNTGTGAIKCVGAYDQNFDPLSSNCGP